MTNLNQSWLVLIVFGVFILIASIGFTVYQSVSGANSEFSATINSFSRNTLILPKIEAHLESAEDFNE